MKKYFDKITSGEIFEAHLSAPYNKDSFPLHFRYLLLKGIPSIQMTERVGAQSFHRNLSLSEGVATLQKFLHLYKRLQIIFPGETVEWLSNRRGEWILQKTVKGSKNLLATHNQQKQHPLPEGTPIPFLIHLGIMKPTGAVYPAKYDKFRQINRFLEIVDDLLKKLPQKKMTIVDFGCGKAYLTFALYYWLQVKHQKKVEILGYDLKAEVVKFCEETAQALGFEKLHFKVGKIEDCTIDFPVDMVVTLHACNTATDAALAKAVKWNAQAILSVPCCQHELFKQVRCELLRPLLKHGLLKERFAALATDAARAELLEMEGYHVDIVEFVDPEHTPKNLMIRAIKGGQKKSPESYQNYVEFLNITPCLSQLLGENKRGN